MGFITVPIPPELTQPGYAISLASKQVERSQPQI